MTEFKLTAKTRVLDGKKTRQEGYVPAIIYGNNFENKKIALEKLAFNRLYRDAGTSNLIDLDIEGETPLKSLIHDVQLDPIALDVVHADLLKVNMKKKIHAEIPLVFVGESRAVADLEGTLITAKDSVPVECLPAALPPEIPVDISVLDDFEKDIHVSDLKVAPGVEILDEPDDVVARVEPPRSEAELEAELAEPIEAKVEEVEVLTEKKEELAEGEKANTSK
ncbi:MAG: 50S ribosomal protein L25 [Patescibacteria group bacterium]